MLLALAFASTLITPIKDPLAVGFQNPPLSARPHTWWHWMNGNVTAEGITADLEAMKEVGIDLSNERPKLLTSELVADARFLITMGCGEQCPVVPGARREDWPVDDPHDRPLDEARRIRDDVAARVAAFVEREGWARESPLHRPGE